MSELPPPLPESYLKKEELKGLQAETERLESELEAACVAKDAAKAQETGEKIAAHQKDIERLKKETEELYNKQPLKEEGNKDAHAGKHEAEHHDDHGHHGGHGEDKKVGILGKVGIAAGGVGGLAVGITWGWWKLFGEHMFEGFKKAFGVEGLLKGGGGGHSKPKGGGGGGGHGGGHH